MRFKRPSAKKPSSKRPNFTAAEKKRLEEIQRDIRLINQGVDKAQGQIRSGLKQKRTGPIAIGAGNLKASGTSIERLVDQGHKIGRRASKRK